MSIWNDIVDFFFPRTCAMCGDRLLHDERHICMSCLRKIHRVAYHNSPQHGFVERLFWGRIPIERATSFFYYEGEGSRHLIHAIKYHRRPEVALHLAGIFADEMLGTDFFDAIDGIIPLPLHPIKQMRRGYNQSEYIARGLSCATGIPLLRKVVRRIRNNRPQARIHHYGRHENVSQIFRLVRPEAIAGKHILLVDDVLTTGATILSCAEELAKAPGVRISLFTLALAHSPADQLVLETLEDYMEVQCTSMPSKYSSEMAVS